MNEWKKERENRKKRRPVETMRQSRCRGVEKSHATVVVVVSVEAFASSFGQVELTRRLHQP
jgi:hypothetical protein